MANTSEILIFQNSTDLPVGLQESLLDEGFTVNFAKSISGIPQALEALQNPILLVDVGDEEEAAVACLKRVLGLDIKSHPILVIGKDAENFESTLDRFFKLSTTVSTPCKARDIVGAVSFLAVAAEKGRTKSAAIEAKTIEELAQRHALYEKHDNIPELLFERLTALDLSGRGLQGRHYNSSISEEFLEQNGYMPADEWLQMVIRAVCTDAGKWGRNHLLRVCYLAGRISDIFQITDELRVSIRQSSFLFAMAFAGDHSELLRKQYHHSDSMAFRKELCSRIKDSAMKVSVDLKLPETGKIIAAMAHLVGAERPVGDDDYSLLASLLMAADMTDRACFCEGVWSTRQAYFLLRRIKAGDLSEIHPTVLCCVTKLLSERIAASPNLHLVPRALRDNPQLQEEARRNREEVVGSNEQKVPIDSLSPGMRLSRPLVAFDGRKVLAEDLVLDQDLIWRIWQLSAVRPLNAPLVIRTDQHDLMSLLRSGETWEVK